MIKATVKFIGFITGPPIAKKLAMPAAISISMRVNPACGFLLENSPSIQTPFIKKFGLH
jgi:hypothetical protein